MAKLKLNHEGSTVGYDQDDIVWMKRKDGTWEKTASLKPDLLKKS